MKLVIFDFDGVLVDTLSVCFHINRERNRSLSLEDYVSFFNGNINDARQSNGEPVEWRPDFDDEYRVRTRELKIPNELKILVQKLSKSHTLAIVSSTPTVSIKNILEREGVLVDFADVLGNDVDKSKVVKIKMLFEKYNALPGDCIYITDTIGDIKEARECGVKAVAVTWGYQNKETLAKANPVALVNTGEELESAIVDVLK